MRYLGTVSVGKKFNFKFNKLMLRRIRICVDKKTDPGQNALDQQHWFDLFGGTEPPGTGRYLLVHVPGRDNPPCSGRDCPRLPQCRRETGPPASRRAGHPGPTSPLRTRSPQPCSAHKFKGSNGMVQVGTYFLQMWSGR